MKAPQSKLVNELREKGYSDHDILSFLLGEISLDGKRVERPEKSKAKDSEPIQSTAHLARKLGLRAGEEDDEIIVNIAPGRPLTFKVLPPWQDMKSAPKDDWILIKDAEGEVHKAMWAEICVFEEAEVSYDWIIAYSEGEEDGIYMVVDNPVGWIPMPK